MSGEHARRRSIGPAGAAAVLVVVLLVVPLVVMAAALRSTPRELDVLQQRDAPATVIVDSSATWQRSSEASVTVHLDGAHAASIAAPPWKGTVTAVLAPPGSDLHAGDPLLEIDGVRRIYAPSPSPFWRVPAWGDHGSDVDGLASFFNGLGLMPEQPPGTPFGAAHVQAVERLAAQLGATPTSTLDLGWLVWSPVAAAKVPVWSVAVGSPAPAPGSVLLSLPRAITSVSVASTDGAPLGDVELRHATFVFGGDAPVPGATVLDAPDQVPALRRASEASLAASGAAAPPVGAAGAVPGGGANGAPAGGAAGSAQGDPNGSGTVETTRTVRSTVRGDRISGVAALPLGAVVTDADGGHCLVGLDRRPLTVWVVGSDSARVYVRGATEHQVTANPASAFGITSCH